MSYFKQLYAKIKHAGYKLSRYQCHECGNWNGPIAFGGVYFTVKCTNPDCPEYGKPKNKLVKRG